MKIKNIILCLIVIVSTLLNVGVDFKEYEKLKINDVPSINASDLLSEFGEGAFKTVEEFIKKTHYLNREWVIFFDYITGEILKCKKGGKDRVSLNFEEKEFEGHHVSSIHNHPHDVYSPPSGDNFGILLRNFEDYELIAGFDCFWILKAINVNMILNMELKLYADLLLASCQNIVRKNIAIAKRHTICAILCMA